MHFELLGRPCLGTSVLTHLFGGFTKSNEQTQDSPCMDEQMGRRRDGQWTNDGPKRCHGQKNGWYRDGRRRV